MTSARLRGSLSLEDPSKYHFTTDSNMATTAVQQYYVAVGSSEMKMVRVYSLNVFIVLFFKAVLNSFVTLQTTLVDLLLALQANGPFGMAVLCGYGDSCQVLCYLHGP